MCPVRVPAAPPVGTTPSHPSTHSQSPSMDKLAQALEAMGGHAALTEELRTPMVNG